MRLRRLARALLVAGLARAVPEPASAAPHGPFNRPGDDWSVAETRYFRFYFTKDTPATVSRLIELADATFERLNEFYGADISSKIRVNVVGYTSFSNGYAEYQRNRITIYATPANFHARSRVPWLENVFTHELSHVLSLNRASRWSPRVPVAVGTGVARSSQAQGLVRIPLYADNYPHWLVEGVAQFDAALLGRDSFDENRAAFERAGFEDGMFYSLAKLAFYGDERWYNTGFAFLRYVERRFGEGAVHRVFRAAGERYALAFDGVFEAALGVPLSELEQDFRAEVAANFAAHRARVHGGAFDGSPVLPEGVSVPYERRSYQEREDLRDVYTARPLRFLGDRLFYRQGEAIKSARFSAATHTLTDTKELGKGIAFAANGASSYFVLRQEGHDPSLLPNVYRPDFESPSLFLVSDSGEERRLAAETRWMDFDVSLARKELAAVYNDGDGSLILALYPLVGAGTERVRVALRAARFPLPPQAFDEVRSPRYSPDGKKLFFSRRIGDDHDVFYLDFERGAAVPFAAEDAFELYPEPTSTGAYFVSSRDGTMSVYFKRYGAETLERVTEPITGHHYPVGAPSGVFVSRYSGTGFRPFFVRGGETSRERVTHMNAKRDTALRRRPAPVRAARAYSPFSPKDWVWPSIAPLIDVEYEHPESTGGGGISARAGVELYAEDALRTQALWFRGFVGNESSFFLSYRNEMTFLSLEARAGFTQSRGLYTFDRSDGQSFEYVTDYRWGFLSARASVPLNLFYRVGVHAETLRDLGSTLGATPRTFSLGAPRYGRDMAGVSVAYSGIDRSDPSFRERWVNKRGYRETELFASYAVEEIDPYLLRFDPTLHAGRTPYFRGELAHTEYVALPKLANGFFDHTLQLDAKVGYIGRNIAFLPFYGGGRLYSQTTAELNTSVGFAGYSPYSVVGETLISLGATYRFPLARRLSLDWGPLYLEDLYAQVFTSWGNIWAFDADGSRQRPLLDRAPNGQHLLGDVGVDLRLLTFFQDVEANMGTTLRVVYRLVPFTACPGTNVELNPSCLGVNGSRGFMYYLLLGSGF